MNQNNQLICSFLGMLLLVAAGCNSAGRNPSDAYLTVDGEPAREIDLARRHHAKALELIGQGKLSDAETELKAALAADITFGPAHNNLGKLYFERKELYLAAWEFQYAIQLMPSVPEPRSNLGLVFEAVGKMDQAVEHYGKAKDLAPDNPQFTGNLVRAKIRRGDQDKATEQLLEEVVLKDSRADWVAWARERLMLRRTSTTRPLPYGDE